MTAQRSCLLLLVSLTEIEMRKVGGFPGAMLLTCTFATVSWEFALLLCLLEMWPRSLRKPSLENLFLSLSLLE